MDYLDPVKSIYSVPYRALRRFAITLLGMSLAYVLGAGPSILVKNPAAIPAHTIARLWTSPIAALTLPFTLFAFIYVVFTERPLRRVVATSMILVYGHCFSWRVDAFVWGVPFWWASTASVAIGVCLYLLYRLFRRMHKG